MAEHSFISNVAIKRHIRDTRALMGQEAGYMSRKSILDYKLLAVNKQLGIEPKKDIGGGKTIESFLRNAPPTDPMKKMDALFYISARDYNPNADPDDGNRPRKDQTGHGLISCVSIKRHISDTAPLLIDQEISRGIVSSVCITRHARIHWFGDVQLRGPFQVGWARSLDPVHVVDDPIVRLPLPTKTNDRLQTFGSRPRVAFGLYRGEIGFTPAFALATKLSGEDMKLFWECLVRMYENTRSSARDQVVVEQVIVFEHDSSLGCAPPNKLFQMVQVKRKDETKAARSVEDYTFPTEKEIQKKIDDSGYTGVKVHFLL